MLKYKTVFCWKNKHELHIFYKITWGASGISTHVPAGIEFTHRKKTYSTEAIISLLPGLAPKAAIPSYKPADWLACHFDKAKFMALQKAFSLLKK